MCGLLGGIWHDGVGIDEERARDALRSLAHRGPDAEGLDLRDGMFLGHRRLSIIDLDPRAIEAIARSLRLLAVPVPDTFLGRKTQEPFPTE